jgi:cold shock CspA family protein
LPKPLTGTLRSWNEGRGFGFIAPTDGTREVFVHISAFPRDGSRPTVGEQLFFDTGPGKDGKPRAINVRRHAVADSGARRRKAAGATRPNATSILPMLVAAALAAVLGAYGYSAYKSAGGTPAPAALPDAATQGAGAMAAPSSFRCDGRKHCSEMTSCAEAKFFLATCPGTTMDGDNDGVPCEQQWCTGPLAR